MASACFQKWTKPKKKETKTVLAAGDESSLDSAGRLALPREHEHSGGRGEARGASGEGVLRRREDAVSHAAVICPSQRGGDAGLYDLLPLEGFKSACRPAFSPPPGDNARWAERSPSFLSPHSRRFQCGSERTSCRLCYFSLVFFFFWCLFCRLFFLLHVRLR